MYKLLSSVAVGALIREFSDTACIAELLLTDSGGVVIRCLKSPLACKATSLRFDGRRFQIMLGVL